VKARMRALVVGGAAVLLGTAGAVVLAQPAFAVENQGYCNSAQLSGNTFEPELPNKTNTVIEVQTCVNVYNNVLQASVYVTWHPSTCCPLGDTADKFHYFRVRVNLERRPNGSATDAVVTTHECDFTYPINAYDWSADYDGSTTCSSPSYSGYSSAYDWSGDGYALYDIVDDGLGQMRQDFYGSPLIH
jgi:hypothetical protein